MRSYVIHVVINALELVLSVNFTMELNATRKQMNVETA